MSNIKMFESILFWKVVQYGIAPVLAAILIMFAQITINNLEAKAKEKANGETKKFQNETLGHLEELNKPNFKDVETALAYQTEISSFYIKFKTCLHWSLPLNSKLDKEIDTVFNYGPNYANGIVFENISNDLMLNIFTRYEFRNIMPNYSGNYNFRPTSYNNFLGILEHLKKQLDNILFKYGSSIPTELSTRLEFASRSTENLISSIRIDLKSEKITSKKSAQAIATFMLLLRDDYLLMIKKYTSDVEGSFPILAGKVIKSHETQGQIAVESQFSNY